MSLNKIIKAPKRIIQSLLMILVGLLLTLSGSKMAFSQETGNEDAIVAQHASNLIIETNDKFVTMDLSALSLEEALEQLAEKANVGLSYNTDVIPDKRVSLKVNQVPVHEVLYKLLEGTKLEPLLPPTKDVIVIRAKEERIEYQETVRGTVTDSETGETLPGVNVIIRGTETGTTTNVQGNFELTVPSLSDTLVFSFIGYQSQEVPINGRTEINVALDVAVVGMQDVVVTALGLERERQSIGYSVTDIPSEDLVQGTESNFANMLQGQVAGVNIESTAGGVGSSTRVEIRGISNTSGDNQPLYVVDGVPIDNRVTSGGQSGNVGRWGQSFEGGDALQSINPADIENVTVLRGASAAVLYGERAQHGVILIETKQGTRENFQVNFNNTTTLEQINTDQFDFQTEYGQGNLGLRPQNIDEAGDFRNSWGERFDGEPVIQIDGNMHPYEDLGLAINRADDIFRTGVSVRNDLSVSGGTEASTYYISATDLNQQGITRNEDLDRTSFTLRGTTTYGRLNADVKANFVTEEVNNRRKIGFGPHNIFVPLLIENARNVPMSVLKENTYNDDGYSMYVLPSGGAWNTNPYWSFNEEGNMDNRDRIIGHIRLGFELTDWLNLSARTGVDTYNQRRTEWVGKGHSIQSGGSFDERRLKVWEHNTEALLTGSYNVLPSVTVDGMVGGAIRFSDSETLGFNGGSYIVPRLNTISNMENTSPVYNMSEKEVRSAYGTVDIGYNDYLYLNLTGRNDWSSTLPPDNNSFFYPSIGTSFVFSEAFSSVMPDWLSFGKLRASWAEVGSDTDPYQLSLAYGILDTGYLGQPVAQIAGSTIPLADLKPSFTSEVELGADIRFFDDRLGFDFTWYDRSAINQILSAGVSRTSGYTGRTINAGQLDNTGIELQVKTRPVVSADFSWRSTFNYARNKNMVTALVEGTDFLSLYQPRHNALFIRAVEGREFGEIWGSTYVRDDEGNIVHNNGRPVVGPVDVLGRGTPTWTGGWTNTLNYKNLSLNLAVDVRWGGQFASETNRKMVNHGLHPWTVPMRDGCSANRDPSTGQELPCYIAEGVMQTTDGGGNTVYETNDVAVHPQQYWQSFAGQSGIAEAFIFDANVIYMRQIQISYRLPQELISNVGIQDASVSVVARNPFVIYSTVPNVDPTRGVNRGNAQGIEDTNYPTTRNFGFSLNLQF